MLAKIQNFVKSHQADIILLIGVILISLLSFAMGYIVAKIQEKEPIRIEESSMNYEFLTNIRKLFVYSDLFRIS
jgi:hypothetical protein